MTECIQMMWDFVRQHPDLWNEDIGRKPGWLRRVAAAGSGFWKPILAGRKRRFQIPLAQRTPGGYRVNVVQRIRISGCCRFSYVHLPNDRRRYSRLINTSYHEQRFRTLSFPLARIDFSYWLGVLSEVDFPVDTAGLRRGQGLPRPRQQSICRSSMKRSRREKEHSTRAALFPKAQTGSRPPRRRPA